MKKRYLAIPAVIGLILLSFFLKPVLPVIQLPGECYPNTFNKIPILGCWTNTFSATLLAWGIVALMALLLNAKRRTADEIPSGFYGFFEMVIEGMFGFVEGIAGSKKARVFFPFFMTWFLILLVTNWLGLVPGFDSIGAWENLPHQKALIETTGYNAELVALHEAGDTEAVTEKLHKLEEKYHVDNLEIGANGKLTDSAFDNLMHEIEVKKDKLNIGDKKDGLFLRRADMVEGTEGDMVKSEDSDWAIVPYFRPAATDLNLTLAFALLAMIAVQYYGFKYLGVRGYLSKFFPFIGKGFGAEVAKNPIRGIDVGVGLLELVGEISKIISFAFRLLGNIFAGMVLLFVMATLLPAANIVFFGLEFFVGLIQALVFALLMLIFMNSATESHGHGDDHGDGHH